MIIYYSGVGEFKCSDGIVIRPETVLKETGNLMLSYAAGKATRKWIKRIIKARRQCSFTTQAIVTMEIGSLEENQKRY